MFDIKMVWNMYVTQHVSLFKIPNAGPVNLM